MMSERRKDNKGRVLKTGESQRKDGRYQYRYVTLGNQRRTIYAPTLAELREKEARISEMQKAGVDYQESLIDVKTLLQRYIDLKLFAKVNTLKRYTYTLNKISRYPISDMPISRCTKSDVKKLLITWQSEGLCYETILHYLSFMEQAFQVAVDDGILKVNPCKFDLRDVIPEQQKPVKKLPSEQQLASWLGYVYGNKVYRNKYDIYLVLLYTGLRVSELCGLTFADVDFDHKQITVNKQLIVDTHGVRHIVPPKSKAGYRTIPICKPAEEALRSILRNRPAVEKEPVVDGYTNFICLTRNRQPLYGNIINHTCKTAVDSFNAIVSPDHPIVLSPHTLRHICCTRLMQSGLSPKLVQYIMGHAATSTTMNVYTHVTSEWLQREMVSIQEMPVLTPILTPLSRELA